MKLETVIKKRIPDNRGTRFRRRNKFFVAIFLTAEIILNTFVPFMSGFYFCYTQNMFWLFFLLLSIIFKIDINYHGETIKIKIIRGI